MLICVSTAAACRCDDLTQDIIYRRQVSGKGSIAMGEQMQALQIQKTGPMQDNQGPLVATTMPRPQPARDEVLLRVIMCGICHTELDEIEGRTAPSVLPRVPGHQVIGIVEATGSDVSSPAPGTRVGVAWIFRACGDCQHCNAGEENLCTAFEATGRDHDGGYAEYMTAPAQFVVPIPDALGDEQAAPLLCAGAIGLRSLRLAHLAPGEPLGLMGFGGANHLVLKLARHLHPDSPVLVWSRNRDEQELAMRLGAAWAGDIDHRPPMQANAIIDTTPVYRTVLAALENLCPGGRLVINAIRKEDVDRELLSELDYTQHLWMEKEIKTVANVTRKDVTDMLAIAARACIYPEVQIYQFGEANHALWQMRNGQIRGAKVLQVSQATR
ncbi:MAG: alcohol dehydrogenase catalytic domain-containing protein [Alcanivoracaceae bacterium]|nr:alcohol dehydrogenase catalytic domain-containing protein [Alcanivoracaceae bacterium]